MSEKSADSKDVAANEHPMERGFAQHAELTKTEDMVVMEREPYGPPGLRGLVQNPFVFLCAACSTLGGVLFGYDQGVVSVILVMQQFQVQFPLVAPGAPGAGFYKGLLTAMIELGAFLGALNQGWIADKISRRYSIIVAVVVFIIGSVLQTASVDYAMLTVARLIGGGGIGMLSMVAPLYISEISPPESRGTLLVMEEFCIVFGIVVAYWITFGTRYMAGEWAWRLPFLLQMVPAFFLAAGVIYLPFSPRWLVAQGRSDEAQRSLCRLRRLPASDQRIQMEMMDIQVEVRFHQETNAQKHPGLQGGGMKNAILQEVTAWGDCFRRNCWRRTHVGIMIMFFQQFVGINALIYYSPTLFKTMGLDFNMQLVMSGVLNITQLVGVASSIWTMDTVGRRRLLMGGCTVMGTAHVIISVLVGLYSSNWPAHRDAGWASVAMLFIYMLFFGGSVGVIGWALPSEIFPSSLRAKGVALSTCSNWLNNFIIGLITPPLIQNTNYGTYIFFAVWCFLCVIWTFFFVPETKGRSLEQMDHVFKDNSSEEEKDRRRAIEGEIFRAAESGV